MFALMSTSTSCCTLPELPCRTWKQWPQPCLYPPCRSNPLGCQRDWLRLAAEAPLPCLGPAGHGVPPTASTTSTRSWTAAVLPPASLPIPPLSPLPGPEPSSGVLQQAPGEDVDPPQEACMTLCLALILLLHF